MFFPSSFPVRALALILVTSAALIPTVLGADLAVTTSFVAGPVMATGTCHPNGMKIDLAVPTGFELDASSLAVTVGYPTATALFDVGGECEIGTATCQTSAFNLTLETARFGGTLTFAGDSGAGALTPDATITMTAPFMAPEFEADGVTPVLDPVNGQAPVVGGPRFATFTVSLSSYTLTDTATGASVTRPPSVHTIDVELRPMLASMAVPIESDYPQSLAAGAKWLTPRDLVAWTTSNVMSEYFSINNIEVLELVLADGTTPNNDGLLTAPDANSGSPAPISLVYDMSSVGFDARPETDGSMTTHRAVPGELHGCESASLISFANVNEAFTDTRVTTDPTLVTGDAIAADSIWRGDIIPSGVPITAAAATGRPIKPKAIVLETVGVDGAAVPTSTLAIADLGHAITYELRYMLISSDEASLDISLALPAPRHDVTGTIYNHAAPSTFPPAGSCAPAPDSTATDVLGAPVFAVDGAANSLSWSFPSHSDPQSVTREIVIRCSFIADDHLSPDLAVASATATAVENGIFVTSDPSKAAIRQPLVSLAAASLIAASNPAAAATCSSCDASAWLDAFDVDFCTSASGAPTSMTITSALATPVAAPTKNVDGGDTVRFALAYANTQSGVAHDLTVVVDLDDTCFSRRPLPCGLSLTVTDAAGSPLAYTLAADDHLFDSASPGLIIHALPGNSIAIVSFDAYVIDSVSAGATCAAPAAAPAGYDGTAAAPLSTRRVSPSSTAAQVTIASPSFAWRDGETSFDFTAKAADRSGKFDLAPCESATVTLDILLPEGVSPDTQIEFASSAAGILVIESIVPTPDPPTISWSGASATINAAGSAATIELGSLTNAPDNVVSDVDKISFVVTLWLDASADPQTIPSRVSVRARAITSSGARVTSRYHLDVVQPDVDVALSSTPTIIGDALDAITLDLAVSVPNARHTPAFDVAIRVTIPEYHTFDVADLAHRSGPAPSSITIDGNIVTLLYPRLDPGDISVLALPGVIAESAPSGAVVTYTAARTFAAAPAPTAIGCLQTYAPDPVTLDRTLAAAVVAVDIVDACLGTDDLPYVAPSEELTFQISIFLPEGVNHNPHLYVGVGGPLTIISGSASISSPTSLDGVSLDVPPVTSWGMLSIPLYDGSHPDAIINNPNNAETPGDVITITVTTVVDADAAQGSYVALFASYAYTTSASSSNVLSVAGTSPTQVVISPTLGISQPALDSAVALDTYQAGDVLTWTSTTEHKTIDWHPLAPAYDLVFTVAKPDYVAVDCVLHLDDTPIESASALVPTSASATLFSYDLASLAPHDAIVCTFVATLPDSVPIGDSFVLPIELDVAYRARSLAPTAPVCQPEVVPPTLTHGAVAAHSVAITPLVARPLEISTTCASASAARLFPVLAYESVDLTLTATLPHGTMVPATLTLDIDETWVLESAVLSASFAGIVDADIPLTPDARSLDLTPVAPLIVRPASADPADNELVITVRAHLVPDFRLPLNDWAPSTAPDLPLSATLWHAAAPATYPGIVATRAAPALSLGLRATAATDGSALVDLSLAHVRGFDLAYSDAAAAAIVITLDLDTGMPYAFDTSSFAATAALVGAQLEVSPNERSLVITADPALALELAASATASLVLTPSDAAAACASCDLSGGLTGSVTFVPGGSCAGVNQGARLLGVSEPYAVISRNPPSLAGLTSIGCYEYAVFEGDDYGTDCNAATADPTPLSELPCGWEVAPNSGEVYHALAAKLCSAGAAASAASTFDSFSATCAWGASCLILADGTGITPEGKPCASNALVSVTADLSCATTRMVGVDGVDGGRVLLRRLSQLCGSAGVCGSGKRSWNMIDPAAAPFNLVPAQLTLDAPADWAVGANALAPLSHVPAISITAGTSLSATFNVEDPILSHAGRAVLTIGYEAKVGSSVVLTAVFDGWLPGLTLSGNIATGRFDIGVPAGVKEIILMVSNTASDDLAFIRGIELAVVPTRSTADGTCMDPATSGFNILANPSFDEPLAPVEAGMIGTWAPYMGNSGGELVHTGSALSLVNSDSSDDIIVGQRVELASPQTAFFIAAQVTTDAVSDGYAPYLSIYIDAELESGEWDYGKHVAIKPGTTAASMITGSVRYDEPVVALTVYVMHRFHTGALVVDEVSVLPYPYACADIPLAAAYGDPHIRSYDGLDWSFQASGDFVLTGTRDYSATTRIAAAGSAAVNAGAGVSLAGRPAVAIIRTDPPAPGLPIAWPRIALRLPGAAEWQTLDTSAAVAPGAPLDGELDVGDAARATVRISYGWSGAIDAAAALRLQVDYIGSGGFGLKVNVLASSYNVQYLYIRPVIPAFTQGQIFGLLGTPDGDESNDIKASDGSLGSPDNTAFIYSSTFVNSWRARNDALPGTADLVVPSPAAAAQFSLSAWPQDQVDSASATCAQFVGTQALIDACALDLLLTGDVALAAGYTAASELEAGSSAVSLATGPPVGIPLNGASGSGAKTNFGWAILAGVVVAIAAIVVVILFAMRSRSIASARSDAEASHLTSAASTAMSAASDAIVECDLDALTRGARHAPVMDDTARARARRADVGSVDAAPAGAVLTKSTVLRALNVSPGMTAQVSDSSIASADSSALGSPRAPRSNAQLSDPQPSDHSSSVVLTREMSGMQRLAAWSRSKVFSTDQLDASASLLVGSQPRVLENSDEEWSSIGSRI